MKKPVLAAALQYDERKDAAPRVVARGQGELAAKIIALAKQKGIPIQSDPALVEILSRLDIDAAIPVELYRAVAEILAFVYQANDRYRERTPP